MEEQENSNIEVIGSSKANSLSAEAWRRLKKNRYAISGLVVILAAAFIALFSPLFRPDGTVDADESIIEIIRKKPGFSTTVLKISNNKEREESVYMRLGTGGKDDGFKHKAIFNYEFDYPYIEIEEYSKNKEEEWYIPHMLRYKMIDVAFNLSDSIVEIENIDGTVSFLERGEDELTTLPYEELEALIVSDFIEERTYWLGTDDQGRDYLSRLMGGTVISLSVGFIAVLISLLIGVTLGAIAGYFRGWVDEIIMWFINVIWSIPALLLVIAITMVIGKGWDKTFIAVGLTMWVEIARVVRGQVLSVREKEYVEAGKALGFSSGRIILRHVLPNTTGPIIVIAAANFASAILIEAGLSFLGLGAQIPTPSWGSMINDYRGYITDDMAYLAVLPGVAIVIMVLAFMLVGNGLRDALDSKSVDELPGA
ncbi:MAG: ABC transporter permease [Crocinitomicaceae bacterium]|jgi:peptide/nickel transport system permease protein|nr:ABC transporter permease [Crocinitomicaceae bacterium]